MKIRNLIYTILSGLAILGLIGSSLMFIMLDFNRNNGRVVNYSGIVRGGAQRISKLHLLGEPIDELSASLEKTIDGLINGNKDLELPAASDPTFLAAMEAVRSYWYDELKQELSHDTDHQHNPETLREKSETFFSLTNEAVNAAETHSIQGISQMKILAIVTFGVNLLCLIVIGVIVHKRVLLPLKYLESGVAQVAKGNLSAKIEYHSKDELGSLADSMRQMIENLCGYIQEIQYHLQELSQGNLTLEVHSDFQGDFTAIEQSLNNIITSLSQTMNRIENSTDQVALNSSTLADSFQCLVSGSMQEVQSMETLSATVTNISTKIGHTAQNASNMGDMIQKVDEQIKACGGQMDRMVQAMERISKSASEIEKVTKTIEDISFQTNILALNAAVEAARAGEAGKGFAVVADEVRGLANKSSASVQDTAILIQDSLASVGNGAQIVEQTAKMLQEVIAMTQEVTGMVDSITGATAEQFQSIEDIMKEIQQINDVVSNNSATTEESVAAGEALSNQAQILNKLVRYFRLKDNDGQEE